MRRLLRFTTRTPNIGEGALHLGQPGRNPEYYTFSECHNHYHFNSYAKYELVDLAGNVVAGGGKRAFALIDYEREDPNAGLPRYTIGSQGISVGWADVYRAGLECQWIDVTDISPGEYVLEVEVNPERLFLESDYMDNAAAIKIVVPDRPGRAPKP